MIIANFVAVGLNLDLLKMFFNQQVKTYKMKNILTLLTLCLCIGFLSAQDAPKEAVDNTTSDGPVMEFNDIVVDYGTIKQNSEPFRVFNFTNTGTEPLVIKHAKGSCGCTVPTYPKEPILPGESNEVKVRYDTKRIGKFTKTVTLTTNEDAGKRVLTIKGEVLKPEAEPAAVPLSEPSILNGGN